MVVSYFVHDGIVVVVYQIVAEIDEDFADVDFADDENVDGVNGCGEMVADGYLDLNYRFVAVHCLKAVVVESTAIVADWEVVPN